MSRIYELNESFASGDDVSSNLDRLKLLNPFVLDWNGTLASDFGPTRLRPDAPTSLNNILAKNFVPFILTLADDRSGIYQTLLKEYSRNFEQNIVVCTRSNWSHLFSYPHYKQVAHWFGESPHLIPIIDNDSAATTNNPYMDGYHVRTYEPQSKILDALITYKYNTLLLATSAALRNN